MRGFSFHRRAVDLSAGAFDHFQQRFFEAEVLKQCDQIRKGFMKRGRISAGRFGEEIALAIDQGVRGFVGNNVVRKACEHGLAGEIVAWI